MRPLARVSVYYIAAVAALLGYGLAFADPVAPVVTKTAFNWTPFVPLLAAGLGSFGAWTKAWTPSTGFFHTAIGHSLVMLAAGLLSAGAAWAASGHLGSDSLLNGLIGVGVGWFSGLKPNGTDAAIGVLGKDRTDIVKSPTTTGGAA